MSPSTTSATTSIAFVADPKADLILKSSDGVSFPIRRVHLQSSCDVFDGMLSVGTDIKAEKDTRLGLAVVKLQDKAKDLDVFLRFIDRDQDRRPKTGQPLNSEELRSLLHLADKYGAKALIDALDLTSVTTGLGFSRTPDLFGLCLSHGLIETARAALAHFQRDFKLVPRGARTADDIPEGGDMSGGEPWLISEIPKADLARVPFDVVHNLLCAQDRVLLHGAKWANEAKKIKLT